MTSAGAGGTGGTAERLAALLDAAVDLYRDRPAAVDRLTAQRARLGRPLQGALGGRGKAGKSTLPNAPVGEGAVANDGGGGTRGGNW